MVFSNSVKNLLRARGKTALFFVLLWILTLLIGLDGYIWYSVTGYLDACDDNYTTIGLLEYMGADYPDERVQDSGIAAAADALEQLHLSENENVLLWDASARAYGFTPGFHRTDPGVYNKNRTVLIIKPSELRNIGLYWATVTEAPYTFHDRVGMMLYVDACDLVTFENGHYYLVSGEYYSGPSSYKYFRLQPYSSAAMPAPDPVYLDITDPASEKGYTVPEDSIFFDIAATAEALNNSLDVFATADLDAMVPIHQSEMVITSGRGFTPEEYASSAKVCIVSERLCAKVGCGLGDTLPLSLIRSGTGTLYESYFEGTGTASTGDYQIVGVMQTSDTTTHYVYVPAGCDPVFDDNIIGYTLGTAVLKNGSADAFYAQMQSVLPDRVRLSVYDQGYAAAEKPFREILRVTYIVTAVCALAGLCIVVMFGFLFVYRQRDVAVTMIRLGAGKRRVYAYFLFGSGLLALIASGVGAVLAYLLSGGVGYLVTHIASAVSPADLRYSNAALSVVKDLPFTPKAPPALFALAALGIFLLAMLCCLAFTVGALRKRRARSARKKAPQAAGTGYALGGKWKYTLLSIARGGMRSAIAPATALLAAVFLCQLTASAASYRRDYASLFADSVIRGCATDNHGKATGKLAVFGVTPNELLRSGYVEDLSLSKSMIYLYVAVSYSDGQPQEYTPIEIPTNDYGYETFMDKVMAGPSIVLTNCLEKSPEFFYSRTVRTEYMDGFDGSLFGREMEELGDVSPCLISTDMAEREGIKPGDAIVIWIFQPDTWGYIQWQWELTVVGTFVKAGAKDNIYCPLTDYISRTTLTAEPGDPAYEELPQYSFNSLDFRLAETAKIDEFKTWLQEEGYSDVAHRSRVRIFLQLDDRSLNATSETLSRQIRYTDVLYPCLYVLTGAAAYVAAYLLVVNRKREYAIMRVLGTPPGRAFAALFFEQVLLCLPGAALGLGVAFAARIFTRTGALLAAGFALCWLLGSAVALMTMNNKAVLATIHEEE